MLTDYNTEDWNFVYDELSLLGTMTTQDCVVWFRVDGGSPTIYNAKSADPHDPFGEGDVHTVAGIAFRYLGNWWRRRTGSVS